MFDCKKMLTASLLTASLLLPRVNAVSTSTIVVTQNGTKMSVTLPAALPLQMDSEGVVKVADSVPIVNNSYGPITISDVKIEANNGWVITDNPSMQSGAKEFSLNIDRGSQLIQGKQSSQISYTGKISPQTEALSGTVANAVFVIDWYTSTGNQSGKYVLATDDDFSGTLNGKFKYIGTADYVEVPHTIKGVAVTSYSSMFSGATVKVKGVRSTNTNIVDTSGMFMNYTGTELDVSELNMSSVTKAASMFYGCKNLTYLNVAFDVSSLKDAMAMFSKCSGISEFDLRSWNTANITAHTGMFTDCTSAVVGRARTQGDADKLNAIANKPATLTFIVY